MSTVMDEPDEVLDDNRGIRCPSCGCRHCPQLSAKVLRTIAIGQQQSIRRQRQCRHCGRRFVTQEIVVRQDETGNGLL